MYHTDEGDYLSQGGWEKELAQARAWAKAWKEAARQHRWEGRQEQGLRLASDDWWANTSQTLHAQVVTANQRIAELEEAIEKTVKRELALVEALRGIEKLAALLASDGMALPWWRDTADKIQNKARAALEETHGAETRAG